MFVYKMVVHKSIIDAFDPTKVFDEGDYNLGLFSSKKKANEAFVKMCDDEFDWENRWNKGKVEVETSYPNEYKTRVEVYGKIIWLVGKIEKIKLQ